MAIDVESYLRSCPRKLPKRCTILSPSGRCAKIAYLMHTILVEMGRKITYQEVFYKKFNFGLNYTFFLVFNIFLQEYISVYKSLAEI